MIRFSGINVNKTVIVFLISWVILVLINWQVETNYRLSKELESLKNKVDALEKAK